MRMRYRMNKFKVNRFKLVKFIILSPFIFLALPILLVMAIIGCGVAFFFSEDWEDYRDTTKDLLDDLLHWEVFDQVRFIESKEE